MADFKKLNEFEWKIYFKLLEKMVDYLNDDQIDKVSLVSQVITDTRTLMGKTAQALNRGSFADEYKRRNKEFQK
jgi:predicted house-cleaning noncanonical NTP pyrophosphatase (MazG superfamily)